MKWLLPGNEQEMMTLLIKALPYFFAENSSSRVRTVQGVSEEGVPDGVADRRQTQLP